MTTNENTMTIEKTNINDVIDKNYAEFDLGLLCEKTYKSLKHIDMVVYTILNNQHGLSVRTTLNGNKKYVDKNGYIFIGIGQDKLCKLLRTTRPTLLASLKRLEEAELIEVVNVGNMKCNRIYVGKLKRTITLGEYMRNLGIEENEAIEEITPSIDVVNIKDINKKTYLRQQISLILIKIKILMLIIVYHKNKIMILENLRKIILEIITKINLKIKMELNV